jgi:RNA polymerase sigma factor (sigma-70 family)
MDALELRAQLERLHLESYGWALACCSRNVPEAESVLQTVYLKVLEGKARFEDRSSLKTWLFSVIKNTAASARRRHVLQRLRLVRFEQTGVAATIEDDQDAAIYRAEIERAFQQAVAALPRRQGEILQLVFYHDLSLAEAAEVMGISIGSARTHYDRAKKQLRRLMLDSRVFDERGLGREENQGTVP